MVSNTVKWVEKYGLKSILVLVGTGVTTVIPGYIIFFLSDWWYLFGVGMFLLMIALICMVWLLVYEEWSSL